MTMTNNSRVLHDIDPVDLDELLAIAGLQTRRDRKYLVPFETIADLLADTVGLRALDIDGLRSFRYESLYFDTDSHLSYLGAARRRPHRFKVRTRTYLDTATSLLEVKVRDPRGLTVKHRLDYDITHRRELTDDARTFIRSVEPAATVADDLRPALTTTYHRSTLVTRDGSARTTIDTDVAWHAHDGTSTSLPAMALIETKSAGPPCAIDRALWRRGHRPVTISKYCTGLAALHPDLPANKWHRILWRHLDRRGAPQP